MINFTPSHYEGLCICVVDEYQDLIEDIVRDGRLYSVYQHQEVLKVTRIGALLSALSISIHVGPDLW